MMKLYRMSAIVLLLSLFPFFLSAEVTTLGLSNAQELALRNNPAILQMQQSVKIAEAQYMQSLADFYSPSVSASYGFSYLDPDTVQRGITKVTPTKSLTNVFADNYSMGLTVSKPLFVGGKLFNAYNMKKILLDQARFQLQDKMDETAANVGTSFYNLLMLKEQLAVQNSLAQSFRAKTASIQKNYNAGLATEYDFVRMDVQYKTILPNLLKLSNSLSLSTSSFSQLIGVTNDDYELVGNLYDSTNLSYPDISELDAFALASSNDVTLYGLTVSVESTKLSKSIASAGMLPSLAFSLNISQNYKITNTGDAERNWQGAWTAGFQFSMPLESLSPFSHPAQSVVEMDETLKKLELAKNQYLNQLLLQVRTLRMQIGENYQFLQVQKETIQQNDLNLSMLKRQYQAGAAAFQDMTDAEVALSQSQLNYYQAIYNYYSSIVKYNRLVKIPALIGDKNGQK